MLKYKTKFQFLGNRCQQPFFEDRINLKVKRSRTLINSLFKCNDLLRKQDQITDEAPVLGKMPFYGVHEEVINIERR